MKINIKYFGQIADVLGIDQEVIDLGEETTFLFDIKLMTVSRKPELNSINFKLSVNLELTEENLLLKNGDEVSFLPPFSGG